MASGWRYRIASVFGVVTLVSVSVATANFSPVETAFQLLPLFGRLPVDRTGEAEFLFQATMTCIVVLTMLAPLYKPRPRRILDIWMLATKRTIVAVFALATIGYFDLSFRLPRATLLMTGGILLVTIPSLFITIRRRPRSAGCRTVIVGDDPETMRDIYRTVSGDVLGYVSPPSAHVDAATPTQQAPEYVDGGDVPLSELPSLGGLSRLDEVIVEHSVDTAVLVFSHPNRDDFFGAIDTCYRNGVTAKVHRDHANLVLTPAVTDGELVDIDLEPWDPQDHVVKRAFDILFAGTALLVLSPISAMVTVAILLKDGRPLLYSQERTATFGETFTIYKFRTMVTGDEQSAPSADADNDRITRVGAPLRRTHLDEIPQLWSILLGKMSVVGPRAVWADEEQHLEAAAADWRKRWFVKPGLTGLAQINGASSVDPKEKLRYDIEYIRRQSFWFDLKIVVRQLWLVLLDIVDLLGRRSDRQN